MKTKHLLNMIMLCMVLTLYHFTQGQSLQWVTIAGGDSSQCARELQVDDQGNVYTLGQFAGTVDLDPGPATQLATSFDFEDIYLQKLDPNGNLLWAGTFGGAWLQDGTGMALDSAGNIYITGGFDQTVDFDPGPGTSFRVSAGDADIFLLKLDPNGQFQWVKTMGGQLNDFGEGIALDPWGNICLIGNFEGIADFDPGFGNEILTAADSHDIFIAKYSPLGDFLWAGSCPGNRDVNFVRYEIATDDSGNVYTAGGFIGDTDFDPGPGTNLIVNQGLNDIFLLKLDSAGQFQWVKGYGSSGEDVAFALAIDDSQQVNFTGGFSNTVDFGGPSFTFPSQGSVDGFLAQVTPSGNTTWAVSFGGAGFDYAKSISVDAPGTVVVAGQFEDTIVLPNNTLVAQGSEDAFVLRGSLTGNYEYGVSYGGSDETTVEDIAIDNAGLMYLAGSFAGTTDFDFFGGGSLISSTDALDAYTLKTDLLTHLIDSEDLETSVYPNPSRDRVWVEVPELMSQGEWQLHNLQGSLIGRGFFGQKRFQIGLAEFPPGMYLLKIQTEGKNTTQKIIHH